MSLTKAVEEQLKARVVGHEIDSDDTIVLPTGLKKTSRGLIIAPSKIAGGTRSGQLVSADDDDQQTSQPVQQAVKKPAKKAGRKKQQEQDISINTEVSVDQLGGIPTKYAFMNKGYGILVLGLTELSYVPPVAEKAEDGTFKHVVTFSEYPETAYIYCNNRFVDHTGTTNILMIEVAKEMEDGEDVEE